MFFRLILTCCSVALVTQAAVIEVQSGGNAILPCGIPDNMELYWFSLQSDFIPAKVTDLTLGAGGKTSPANTILKYKGRLTAVSDSNRHSLQLKNITEADLLIYCCVQSTGLKIGNCTKLKFTDHPGGQSTPHPLQCTTPQPETLNLYCLHCFMLICFILLLCLIFLACYFYNKASLRKSSD